jgi:hypothetical protein
MNHIHIDAATYRKIKTLLFNSGHPPKKIQAIKLLRQGRGLSLREAKDAIEWELGANHKQTNREFSAKIISQPRIIDLTCDFGDGPVTVSLEDMELTGMMNLERFGVDACMEVVDLVSTLTAYAHGAKIGVIESN